MLDCKRATPKIFAVNLVAPLAGVLLEIRTPVLRGKTKSDRKDWAYANGHYSGHERPS